MELRAHCAYNQTRECFLGLEVDCRPNSPMRTSRSGLTERELRSGEGLWVNPFHGIPMTGLLSPLDLIYLDEDCRVIEAVESYPTFLAALASAGGKRSGAAGPLDLLVANPDGRSTGVVRGRGDGGSSGADIGTGFRPDRRRPQTIPGVQGAVLLREQPLWSGGPGLLELEDSLGASAASMPPDP